MDGRGCRGVDSASTTGLLTQVAKLGKLFGHAGGQVEVGWRVQSPRLLKAKLQGGRTLERAGQVP